MKRTGDDNNNEEQPKNVKKFCLPTFGGDRREEAVDNATYAPGSISDLSTRTYPDLGNIYLSTKPIVIHGVAEENVYDYYILYWPVTAKIGLTVLNKLDELSAKNMDDHIDFMAVIQDAAENGVLEDKAHLDALKKYMDMESADELGQFRLLDPSNAASVLLEHRGDLSDDRIVEEAKLSPFLYRMTCYLSQ